MLSKDSGALRLASAREMAARGPQGLDDFIAQEQDHPGGQGSEALRRHLVTAGRVDLPHQSLWHGILQVAGGGRLRCGPGS